MRRPHALLAYLALLAAGACQHHDARDVDSARQATQAFYDRYVPLSQQGNGATVLGDPNSIVAPDLAAALTADYQAQARDSEEVVGLDFDPFLASQDPCEAYSADPGQLAGDTVRVPVHAICEGKRDSSIAATVELVWTGHSWALVNLRYPGEKADLRSLLATLAADRDGHGSDPRR